ncbi:hypothetical protein KCU61_g437, partial [Aureobasidium melanogenum]
MLYSTETRAVLQIYSLMYRSMRWIGTLARSGISFRMSACTVIPYTLGIQVLRATILAARKWLALLGVGRSLACEYPCRPGEVDQRIVGGSLGRLPCAKQEL